MKEICVFISLLFLSLSVFSQTIYIANNNTGAVTGTNVFTGNGAIGSAITAATAGDIIYVVPSGTNYTAITVNKSLTIIGPGFNPDKTNSLTATVNGVTVNANNVRISGLSTGFVQMLNGFAGTMIDKVKANRIVIGTSNGSTIIQNCVLGENTSGQYSIASELSSNNVRISNNIIYGSTDGYLNNLNGAIVEHNLFVGLAIAPQYNAFNVTNGCTIRNNIFFGMQPGGENNPANFTNNDQRYNLSYGGTISAFVNSGSNGNTATNNIVDDNPDFVNFPTAPNPAAYNFSNDATLQGGSPAIGTGEGGVDIGPHGGATPFDPFGTSIPVVQNVIAPTTVTQGTNMNVRVQAKGN
jgi:hypothetical protein